MSSLTSLLQLSLPKPSSISSTDSDTGGAVLALALHALAINDGFNVAKKSAEQNMSSHSSSYVPAKGWDTALEDQFIFMLSKVSSMTFQPFPALETTSYPSFI